MSNSHYVVDPTLPSAKLVYGLINHDNQSHAIGPATVRLGVPRDNSQPSVPRNTELMLQGLPPAMIGQQMVYYNRLSLAEYLQHVTPLPVRSDVVDSMHDILDVINATYGLAFSKAEIVDSPLDFRNKTTNLLTVVGTCLAWRGQVPVQLTPNRQPISSGVKTNILSGISTVNNINEINANLYGYGFTGMVPNSLALVKDLTVGTVLTRDAALPLRDALRAETEDTWQASSSLLALNLTGATVSYNGPVSGGDYPPAPQAAYDQIVTLTFDPALTTGIVGELYLYYHN